MLAVQDRQMSQAPGREEAKAQRVLLRHRSTPAALRHLANAEGFALSNELIDAACRNLSGKEQPATAVGTMHQLRSALYQAEQLIAA